MMPIARQIFTLSNRQKCCVHALSRHWQLATPSHPSLILPSTVGPNCRRPLSFPCHIAFTYSGCGPLLFFLGGNHPYWWIEMGKQVYPKVCIKSPWTVVWFSQIVYASVTIYPEGRQLHTTDKICKEVQEIVYWCVHWHPLVVIFCHNSNPHSSNMTSLNKFFVVLPT